MYYVAEFTYFKCALKYVYFPVKLYITYILKYKCTYTVYTHKMSIAEKCNKLQQYTALIPMGTFWLPLVIFTLITFIDWKKREGSTHTDNWCWNNCLPLTKGSWKGWKESGKLTPRRKSLFLRYFSLALPFRLSPRAQLMEPVGGFSETGKELTIWNKPQQTCLFSAPWRFKWVVQ